MEANKIVIKKKTVFEIIKQRENKRNVLSNFLDIFSEESSLYDGSNEEIEEVNPEMLPSYLLEPYNISFMTIITPQEDMVFMTLLSDEKNNGLYRYEEEFGVLTLKTMEAQESIALISALMGTRNSMKSQTNLTFTPIGMLTLAILVDYVRRENLENLILHLTGESEITISKIQEIFALSMESKDIRWFAPFVLEVFNPLEMVAEEKKDIKIGLQELANMGLIKLLKNIVHITEQGYEFLELLIQPSGWIGIKSLYYHDHQLQLLSSLFIRAAKSLYYIMPRDVGEQYNWISIDHEGFEEIFGMNIAPGEMPPLNNSSSSTNTPILKAIPENEVKFCIYCGKELTENAKFCRNCGKLVEFT